MKNRIIVAVICVPILFIVMFFLPSYILAGVVSLICAVSAYELMFSIGTKRNDRITVYSVVAAALIPFGVYFNITEYAVITILLIMMFSFFIEAIRVFKRIKPLTLEHLLIGLFGGFIIPLMLSTLVGLRNMQEGRLIVLIPVISAFITDGGAYFSGVFFGKHKAFPRVSPNKTIEGCIGGLVAGMLAMAAYGVILNYSTPLRINFPSLILCGLIGAVFTELGDLAFSLIKREYEIKDYGRILPGHGGLLDRFDSMVFTAPAIYLIVTALPAITV